MGKTGFGAVFSLPQLCREWGFPISFASLWCFEMKPGAWRHTPSHQALTFQAGSFCLLLPINPCKDRLDPKLFLP